MKLLTVSHYFEGHRGGVELVAGRLARELSARGFQVVWAAAERAPPAAEPGLVPVVLSAWNILERRLGIPYPLPSPAALLKLVAAVRRSDAVLVHDSLYLTSVTAALAARFARKPLVVVQHIGEVAYRNLALRLLMRLANAVLARPVLRRGDQVVFISEITARHFDGVKYRRPPRLIFNGVDTTVFQPRPAGAGPDAERGALGLPPDSPVALFVGRFVEKKGLHHLQRLATARPDVTWAFAGWGALDPSAWRLPNVRVFNGLSGPSLAELYRASDVLVLPSTGEGFPLVIQEALACGLPVICGAETVGADPAAASWLAGVPVSGDEEEVLSGLNAALDVALSAPARRTERAGFAAARYGWSGAGDQYAALLDRLRAAKAAPPAPRPVITRPAT